MDFTKNRMQRMNLLQAITRKGTVVYSDHKPGKFIYRIRCFGKLFILTYELSLDALLWNFYITNRDGITLEDGEYTKIES